jgi:serine/threonine protein kinase
MTFLSDAAVTRLRAAADAPDLSGSRYRLVEKIGEGGMGSVYRVEDTSLGRNVALKVVNTHDVNGFAERLLREARIIARLEHPGIVPVHDTGSLPDGRVFYTMKLVQGKRLDEYVRELNGVPERLRVFQKICEAVAFAHARQVLHRDLKPENVMIGPFGEVLVMDWGVSKILAGAVEHSASDHLSAASLIMEPAKADDREPVDGSVASSGEAAELDTTYGAVIGTLGYMAPEQERGDSDRVGERSDVYSLGAILMFLLEAHSNDHAARAARNDRRHDLSPRNRRILNAIVRKATSVEIAERYSSVNDLRADVARCLDGLSVTAFPESWISKSWRWVLRNRVWIVLVLAYLVVRTLLILFRRH